MTAERPAAPRGPATDTGRDAGPAFRVRTATAADAAAIWSLIRDFAVFVKMEPLATGTPERLAANLSGAAWPRVEGFLAEVEGRAVGYALFYGTYSTFWTLPMVWLEDLHVLESHRGQGVGRALFAAVARVAFERGCARMDWSVLEWNTPAIGFYERLGAARHGGDSFTYRLDREHLRALTDTA